jgi:hypothetical protein
MIDPINIYINDERYLLAIEAATDEFNAELPEGEDPWLPEELVARKIDHLLDGLAQAYNIGDITASEFIFRFTSEEIQAIREAAQTDTYVAAFVTKVKAAEYIPLYEQVLIDRMDGLVDRELLTQERRDEIMAYEP